MFFSNVELFWYEFKIHNCNNMGKKCFRKCLNEQQKGVSNEYDITMLDTFILIGIKEKLFPFSVSHTCV